MAEIEVVGNKDAGYGPNGSISRDDALKFANNLSAFKNWKAKLANNFGAGASKITVMDVFTFGPPGHNPADAKAGFVMANATVQRGETKPPGFAFIRGGAVAVLPILHDESGKKFVLTTIQSRVPGAEKEYEEIPAGMLDASSSFGGVAAKEMYEETTLKVKQEDLVPLSLMYPSIGGSDENIKIFLYQAKMRNDEITKLEGIATGNPDENESIKLKIRPYEEFKAECLKSKDSNLNEPLGISDAKAQVALGMYELMLQAGGLPEPKNVSGKVLAAFIARNAAAAAKKMGLPGTTMGGKRRTKKRSHNKKRKTHHRRR
jgi:8-oxo-dGTP pyrophosphatase MutT (NUDIX family)